MIVATVNATRDGDLGQRVGVAGVVGGVRMLKAENLLGRYYHTFTNILAIDWQITVVTMKAIFI